LKLNNELKTGILVVFGIGLFVFGFSYLKSNDIFVSDRTFYAIYSDVEGVVNGTPVTVNGLPVGNIQNISFHDGNQLIVKFRVENDIKFSVNSVAQIYETGLIGGKALAIIPSNDKGPEAVSNDTLKSSIAPGLTDLVNKKITNLQVKIESMVMSADSVLYKINRVFDDSTRSNLRKSVSDFNLTISDLKETSSLIKSIVQTNKSDVNLTISNVSKISNDLSSISSTLNNGDLDLTFANFKKSSDDLSLILKDINKGQGTISKLISNDSLFNNLNDASKSIDLLLEDIRLNPKRYIHFSVFGKKNKPYKSK
jgi:phospholipid/cholesterol/gamma-HCH transport system substrate-binding protein|tara:strand:- start:97 stop:1029 length:933 start_codon:yes stop_codon:yes gene_type:complete